MPTIWLFSQAFGTTPRLWVNLQANYDLAHHKPDRKIPNPHFSRAFYCGRRHLRRQ